MKATRQQKPKAVSGYGIIQRCTLTKSVMIVKRQIKIKQGPGDPSMIRPVLGSLLS